MHTQPVNCFMVVGPGINPTCKPALSWAGILHDEAGYVPSPALQLSVMPSGKAATPPPFSATITPELLQAATKGRPVSPQRVQAEAQVVMPGAQLDDGVDAQPVSPVLSAPVSSAGPPQTLPEIKQLQSQMDRQFGDLKATLESIQRNMSTSAPLPTMPPVTVCPFHSSKHTACSRPM